MNRDQVLDFLVSETEKWGQSLGGCDWTFIDGQYVHTIHDPITIDDWNRAKIKPSTKIRILSEEHRKYVLDMTYEAGFRWESPLNNNEHLDSDIRFMFFWENGVLGYSCDEDYFEGHLYKEIFIEMPEAKYEKYHIDTDISHLISSNEEAPTNINAKVLADKVGSKYDQGKPRYDLIPVHAEAEFVDVLTFGATKYGAENWRKVEDAKTRYQAALGRHIAAYRMGEIRDIESGKHHLAHAMCCLSFIIELDLEDNQ